MIDNKTISMSIRAGEDDLEKLKMEARLEAYASYSEFVRRTALLEANRVLERKGNLEESESGNQ